MSGWNPYEQHRLWKNKQKRIAQVTKPVISPLSWKDTPGDSESLTLNIWSFNCCGCQPFALSLIHSSNLSSWHFLVLCSIWSLWGTFLRLFRIVRPILCADWVVTCSTADPRPLPVEVCSGPDRLKTAERYAHHRKTIMAKSQPTGQKQVDLKASL